MWVFSVSLNTTLLEMGIKQHREHVIKKEIVSYFVIVAIYFVFFKLW